MEKPTQETNVIIQDQLVNPETVYGYTQRIVEIVGSCGRDYELKGINLPPEWHESVDFLAELDPNGFVEMNSSVCKKWGFSLEKIIFDKNMILTEAVIRKSADNAAARIYLANMYSVDREDGKYITEGLNDIAPVMIFQEIMSRYFFFVMYGQDRDRKFDYGYIDGEYGTTHDIGGFYPRNLKIPQKIFELDQQITNLDYQKKFESRASNIAGRFGLDLNGIEFNNNGVLSRVSVDRDVAKYALDSKSLHGNEYYANNVDNAYQAAALHTIVAAHINYLLEKDWSKQTN